MSNCDLDVHVRLFLSDIQKRCKRLETMYIFGIPAFKFSRVRVHGVIVKRNSEMLIIDDATATCRVNLESILHKRFDISKLSPGTLITVTGELKETDGHRWIECEGYDTYYEPHSEHMLALETISMYKNHYFKNCL
ncbi:hypothetical protein C2G38_656368 [Gigaspora rosea]|uniref:Uncharacterized protein n=1 Tax=Gigaspora rosea TaxID=44941 RepID=A0A397U7L2_9GLOM|nr:hypothetical protein C2G38_656368 [Gigaspora rosea]